MKKTLIKHLSLFLLVAMMFGMFGTSCQWLFPDGTTTTTPSDTTTNGDGTTWTPPEDEWKLEREEGYNQITFYWSYPGVIEDCDLWVWWDGKEGSGYLMHECEYGAKATVNVPEGIDKVGFIVRTNCDEPGGSSWGTATKDFDGDREAILTGTDTYIWLKSGEEAQYTSKDGGKTLEMIKDFRLAAMVDFHTIEYSITPKMKLTSYKQIKVWDGDELLTVLEVSSMGKETTTGKIKVEETLDLSKTYELEIEGFGRKAIVPTDIFDSKEFAALYHYDGDDLGSYIHGTATTFKVWAPTASKVVLNLYTKGNGVDAYDNVEMTRGEKGVWEYTAEGVGHGTYYTYTVTTSVGTQIATDPYGKAAGVNGDRTMVVDLDKTDPADWDTTFTSDINSYSDAFIWEVHVRDFSNLIESSQYKGKYLAFTENGLVNENGISVGIDYLVELGVTHVHLNPVYDFATVDETKPDEQFNWGYDPKNYNVPEGSYSTDPYNGEVRITEFKQMVQALHNAGIGVIMDVVYNHTYDKNSSFNRIVPYYYYRYTDTGANSSASGCGNDTASERYMFGKFMVESVTYWLEEYDLDGFRFDLMGLHDLETIKEVEAAVHAIDPKAIIYGEGWTMGSTIDGTAQANQSNISKIEATSGAIGSVAVFNDAIRDGLKGSVFSSASTGYISGNYKGMADQVKFGIRGGTGTGASWTVKNSMVINYMSAHDNNTLWDKLSMSRPDATVEERLAMNRLGAAILFISKGTPFVQAGEEMLRSKPKYDSNGNPVYDENGNPKYDENSYKSCDATNNIRWDALAEGSNEYEMMKYYAGLAQMRKAFSIFTTSNTAITFTNLSGGGMAVSYDDHKGGKAIVLINPTTGSDSYTLKGEWKLVADGTRAGSATLATESGTVTVGACSVRVYVN